MTTDSDRHPEEPDRALLWEAMGNAFRTYAGWAFYGFGALLVLVGYLGISGESVVAKQLPYLISGGIGGILLAILGAYFLSIDELRRDGGRLDRMEHQIEELHRALLERPGAPLVSDPTPTTTPAVSANGHAQGVLVVDAGESYHRPSCALVTGKPSTELDPDTASGQGLRPCLVCEPASVS